MDGVKHNKIENSLTGWILCCELCTSEQALSWMEIPKLFHTPDRRIFCSKLSETVHFAFKMDFLFLRKALFINSFNQTQLIIVLKVRPFKTMTILEHDRLKLKTGK